MPYVISTLTLRALAPLPLGLVHECPVRGVPHPPRAAVHVQREGLLLLHVLVVGVQAVGADEKNRVMTS